MKYRKTIKNITAVALSDAITRGFFFLFNVIMARIIDPLEFGIYGLSISLGVWLWAITDAGLTGHGTRLLAQGRDKSTTISAILIARLWILLGVIVVFGVILKMLPLSTYEKLIYSCAIIYVLGMSLFPAWIARSQHANKEYLLTYSMVALWGFIFLVVLLSGGVERNGFSAGLARSMAWLIGGAFAFWLVAIRMEFHLIWSPQKGLLTHTSPLGAATVLYNLIPLIPFLSVRLLGQQDYLASYSAIMQIQTILLAGAGMFSSVFLPTVSNILLKAEHYLRYVILEHFKLLLLYSCGVSLLYVVFGISIARYLYGNAYEFKQLMIIGFALAFLFSSLRRSLDAILIARGIYKKMAINGLISIILMSISLCVTTPFRIFSINYALGEFVLLLLNLTSAKKLIIEIRSI